MSAALASLGEELKRLVAAHPDLARHAAAVRGMTPEAPEPVILPGVALLDGLDSRASGLTAPFVRALQAAAANLCWAQSYTAGQVGDDHIARYAWTNLASDGGGAAAAFRLPGYRISVGVWGRGLYYPRHWHEPEETYLVLAGGAEFRTDGRPPRLVEAGGTVHHPPILPHAIDMARETLLALAVWTGDGLHAISTLAEDDQP